MSFEDERAPFMSRRPKYELYGSDAWLRLYRALPNLFRERELL